MLSRIAESLFWIGRYVERADDTSRILDAHLQHLLEDPWMEEDQACRSLLGVMGAAAPAAGVVATRQTVLDTLAYDRRSPGAIAGALASARENARRARETLSSELWECLNTTWNALPGRISGSTPHDFFAWVRERAAIVAGLVQSSTRRDATQNFILLGRSLERADMTARLIATRAVSGPAGPGWTTMLRSCGAHEAFLRTYRGRDSDTLAAEFLLMDRLFPRSVLFSLEEAEACLTRLEPADPRGHHPGDARMILGRVRSGIEYQPLLSLLGNLATEMTRVQQGCSEASDAVRLRYFPSGATDDWIGGRM
ncbi:alpha-E domain-containing protein [Occultella glacieicola]|uniref:Alpha-E domain-containing protein n=1 Tax=Occultella glacieicola TaxID=2518684 RepID=A0ABY2DZ29_9MICO|nr:alpha-E domain-containing protein [Occultella glacieicola]TDE89943.1 alpha-E domain-containing protein [Occultella glacieicola]